MIEQYIDADGCVEQLRELIMIPSPTGDEEKIAERIGSLLSSIRFEVEYQGVEGRRMNVMGRRKWGLSGPSILVGGHLDTVRPVQGWSKDPFVPSVENNRIFGLGACDMKGGIAALLAALKALQKDDHPFGGEIIFAGLVDEEAFSKGAKTLIRSPVHADMALLAEPHFDEMIIGSFGKVLLEIRIEGKGAHASHPATGINAVEEAAKLITHLGKLPARKVDGIGTATQCVLKIHGGPQEYSLSVPENCSFELSRHLIPSEDAEGVVDDIHRLAKRFRLKGAVTIEIKDPYYPAYEIREDERIVRLVQQAYQTETSQKIKVNWSKSVSDANLLVKEKEIPTVLFGPQGGNIHSADEYVLADSLIATARTYARFFEMLLSGKG
jgi:succinyl-diaminopimelate desuccinylase